MSEHSAEMDPGVEMPLALVNGADIGRWIMAQGLDRPKRIIAIHHHEGGASVEWYRDPEKRDAKSFMKARHDYMVTIYVTPPREAAS